AGRGGGDGRVEEWAWEGGRAEPGATIGHVAGRLAVEVKHEKGRPPAERALPPAQAPARDHALQREMGNDALIGAPPSLLIGGSESRSILQPRRPNVDDINGHSVSLTRVAAFGKGVVAVIQSGVTLRHACGAREDDQATSSAMRWRSAFLRSLGSRWRLRRRIDFGVTSTSSWSAI